MKLYGSWSTGPYLYQLWETEDGYLCQGIDAQTLDTLCEGEGDTPLDAIAEAMREALRLGS